jgi:hypothetical protein
MNLTPETVADQATHVHDRADRVVPLVNDTRAALADAFDEEVDAVEPSAYHGAIDAVFATGDLAVNVAALVMALRRIDVAGDYPGFIVDELLARELAAMIAGEQPLRMLAEATFHYADVIYHEGAGAGEDDLDAAIAAGVQTRLPGWDWTARPSPFTVAPEN